MRRAHPPEVARHHRGAGANTVVAAATGGTTTATATGGTTTATATATAAAALGGHRLHGVGWAQARHGAVLPGVREVGDGAIATHHKCIVGGERQHTHDRLCHVQPPD